MQARGSYPFAHRNGSAKVSSSSPCKLAMAGRVSRLLLAVLLLPLVMAQLAQYRHH